MAFSPAALRGLAPEAHAVEVCRDMADLPEDLRRRVEVARGLAADGADQPAGANVVPFRRPQATR